MTRFCLRPLCTLSTMNMLSEAGPSHYASSTLPPSLSVDADTRRPAFTYASKAIVDESWTQVEAFPKDEEDDASDYETEEEVTHIYGLLDVQQTLMYMCCVTGLLCYAGLWERDSRRCAQTSRSVSAYSEQNGMFSYRRNAHKAFCASKEPQLGGTFRSYRDAYIAGPAREASG